MLIQPTTSSISKHPAYNYQQTNYMQNSYVPVFTGHARTEKVFKKGIKQLINQTAFNRNPQTKDFVCDYIHKYLGNKDTIKIVSGGCSTGEEAVTYSMKLYDSRKKVEILGIDLGKKAIESAKSRRYVFEIPSKRVQVLDFFDTIEVSPFSDSYLVSDSPKGLNANEKMFKALFNEFFEPTYEKIKTPLIERLQNMYIRRTGAEPLEVERIACKLKDGMAENCHFVQGDIQDIDKILNGEKVDVISFSNALYHLTTQTSPGGFRIPKDNSESIVESLMIKFKNCLNENGLVVFGENEELQMLDDKTVPKVMKKLCFTPLNKTDKHDANVWKFAK